MDNAELQTVSSEGEYSGEEASGSSSWSCAEPETESLLSRLKAADRSVLCRKRSVASNPAGKRPKKIEIIHRSSSVTPQQRAREFSSEFIGVSAATFFCRPCREELSLKKSSM